MSQKERRRLELSIDGETTAEIVQGLQSVINRVKNSGNGAHRYTINGTIIQFDFDSYGEREYRIEEINGKVCFIYKSKL
jgi:hypothetical protein